MHLGTKNTREVILLPGTWLSITMHICIHHDQLRHRICIWGMAHSAEPPANLKAREKSIRQHICIMHISVWVLRIAFSSFVLDNAMLSQENSVEKSFGLITRYK